MAWRSSIEFWIPSTGPARGGDEDSRGQEARRRDDLEKIAERAKRVGNFDFGNAP